MKHVVECRERDEANARLIAAAPELLQAIKDLFRERAKLCKVSS